MTLWGEYVVRMDLSSISKQLIREWGITSNTPTSGRLPPHNGKLRKEREEVKKFGKYKCLLIRPSYCFQYIGEGIEGYEDLMQNVDKMRYDKSMEGQLMLF